MEKMFGNNQPHPSHLYFDRRTLVKAMFSFNFQKTFFLYLSI